MSDGNDQQLQTQLLRNIHTQLQENSAELRRQADKLQDVRERLIRLETVSLGEKLEKLENDLAETNERLIVMETQGKVYATGVAAAVSILVSVFSGMILWLLKRLDHSA